MLSDDDEDEDEWPPFKKVGAYDPYSDDPRLAIKKVTLCPTSGKLIVGGTAGQVVVLEVSAEASDVKLTAIKADLVTEKEGFAWKGHSALSVKPDEVKLEAGHYHPKFVLQMSPPASVNSLTFSAEWDLVASGTAHGLVLFDCVHGVTMLTKCTLNAQGTNPTPRRQIKCDRKK